ncbi:MAG: hypothetical protein WDZ57_04260 [Demequina sp.]
MANVVTGMRVLIIGLIAVALTATLTDTSGLVPDSKADIAAYYTFQTNIVCAAVLVTLTWHRIRHTIPHPWVEWGRAFSAVNLVVMGLIYWAVIFPLGTEHGPQMTWVMVLSHVVTPLYLGVEYLVVGNRSPLPLARWWVVAGYAGLWTVVTVTRSARGDFVPYDHLDPAQREWSQISFDVAFHSALLLLVTVVALRWRRWRIIPEPASAPGERAARPEQVSADEELSPSRPVV